MVGWKLRPLWEVGWEEFWLSFAGRQIDDLLARNFFGPAEPVLETGLNAFKQRTGVSPSQWRCGGSG